MTEPKKHNHQIYDYPEKEEIEHLYIEKNHTQRELAELYDIPTYTVAFVLRKYGIVKSSELKGRTKHKVREFETKGLTKEVLYDLYVNQKLTVSEICNQFDDKTRYIYKLIEYWEIPKRTKEESHKIIWDKRAKEKLEASKTFIGKKVSAIKKQIQSGEIDVADINHQKACILLSCNPGIEKLRNLCDLYGFNFQILANVYRKLEPVWYKLPQNPSLYIKIAITLHLRYKITKSKCSAICHISEVSFRTFYDIIMKRIKLTKEKREDPLTIVNIRWIFDNPDLPEIYELLPYFSAQYGGYYCNIRDGECGAYDPWTHRCYKQSFYRCFYAFSKYKKPIKY